MEVFYFSGLDSLKFQESNYVNNQKDGKSYEYDTSGNIITIINYNMGLLVDKKKLIDMIKMVKNMVDGFLFTQIKK